MQVLTTIINYLFLADIIIIFNSATLTDDFETIDDRDKIAWNYLTSWFFIDIVSIIPFEYIIKVDPDSLRSG